MIGHYFLFLSCLLATIASLVGVIAAIKKHNRLFAFSRNALLLMALFSILSLLSLASSFVQHNYKNLYVWQNSSNEMPYIYLISAIWGGMDGSMLLWASIMAIFSGVAVLRLKYDPGLSLSLRMWLVPSLSFPTLFFLAMVLFLTNPFKLIADNLFPTNGNGLNPLLQNPSMMIHPPLLYLGFTGFLIPFSFCLAALLSGDLSYDWIKAVRRWTLIAWTFLTAGIILGGNWAYIELGWGGFWAWDPVENASFMPWLTGTAFMHSVMVQERRGMLKIWNIFLICLTYLLTVFGTFLTRSGLVQSVHAFAETDVGWVFLVYLIFFSTLLIALVVWRRKQLRSENQIISLMSREAVFLFNNLVLLGICFVTLWGVMLPIISEAVSGEKLVVGPPFFNSVNNPLFIALIFLMAVGPIVSWRKTTIKQFSQYFIKPFILASIISIFLIFIDPSRYLTAITFGVSSLVISTLLLEFYKAAKARALSQNSNTSSGMKSLLSSRRRKYAAYIVHIAVALSAISIVASYSYKIEKDITLSQGEEVEIGNYRIRFDSLVEGQEEGYGYLKSVVSLYDKKNAKFLAKLAPEKRIYANKQEVTTEVDIYVRAVEDFYIALAGLEFESASETHQYHKISEKPAKAVFKVFINPLQVWLWFSSVLMLIGSLMLIFDKRSFL